MGELRCNSISTTNLATCGNNPFDAVKTLEVAHVPPGKFRALG
jgi:hypothetical protein